MAIFHLSVKPISRSAGRSSTAAAAYRAGVEIVDQRTGEIHDYTRKGGVESADMVLPDGAPEWATDRAKLWNAAELAEKRKDACVAREFEVALPAELSADQRRRLALDFAKDMANREGCAVDVAIHAPGKGGDNRNHHAHILRTTRKVEADGLGAKLDTEQAGRKRKDDLEQVRERWADLTNAALEKAGHAARIDHRSLVAQGIEDREAGIHLGPTATAIERRGEVPEKTERHQERQQEAAGKVAAMVAIAEAQAKAAEQAAQAQREAAAAAIAASQAQAAAQEQARRAAAELEALNTKLTAAAEAKEKEDDRIRATALAALAKSSAAIDRACGFTVADHAATDKAIDASRGHLVASARVANNYGPSAGNAIEGAQRRVARNYLESSVAAVANQLGRVDKVLQQASRLFTGVVGTLATAAQAIAKQLTKAAERPTPAAPAPVKAITPAAPEKPPEVVLEVRSLVTERELEFADRAQAAIRSGNGKELQACLDNIGGIRREAGQALAAVEPQEVNQAAIAHQVKTEQNEMARKNGDREPWYMSGIGSKTGACAWDDSTQKAVAERDAHAKTDRPKGLFKGAEGKAWDERSADLAAKATGWAQATERLKRELALGIDQRTAKEAQAVAAANRQNAPQHAKQLGRAEAIADIETRLKEAIQPHRERELARENNRQRGM